jgi:hypothetical protein
MKKDFLNWIESTNSDTPELNFVEAIQEEYGYNEQYQQDWAYGFFGGYRSCLNKVKDIFLEELDKAPKENNSINEYMTDEIRLKKIEERIKKLNNV